MKTHNFPPSSFYPEYFKSDIHFGTPKELPLSKALDFLMGQFLTQSVMAIFHSSPVCPSLRTKEWILRNLEFCLEGLDEDSVSLLYTNRSNLFKLRGTLAAIRLLAECHFATAAQFPLEVFRGLPFNANRIPDQDRLERTRLNEIRLSQVDEYSVWTTVQLEKAYPKQVISSFQKNCRIFVPSEMQVMISCPNEIPNSTANIERGWNLTQTRRLTQRRI